MCKYMQTHHRIVILLVSNWYESLVLERLKKEYMVEVYSKNLC